MARRDPNYEERGQDYPVGFVRWTEQRNFEAVLDMMYDGRLDVKPLISHRFDIGEAEKAYDLVGGSGPSLGILLSFPGFEITSETRTTSFGSSNQIQSLSQVGSGTKAMLSFLGSGNYATAVLIPAFKDAGAYLRSVASSTGVSGLHAGRKFGFNETTTDIERIFADEATNAVVISTRHDSHARFVMRALEAGKHIFVEKPLCITLSELKEIKPPIRKGEQAPSACSTGRFQPLLCGSGNESF